MTYSTEIVRPELRGGDVLLRGEGMPPRRLKAIRKGLRTLHTLELMAVTIYRFQISGKRSEHDRRLIAAMCNEMTHLQDFQVKLYEYGFTPSKLHGAYLVPGFVFGFVSKLLGRNAVLATGIWVERKAVRHYGELLETVDWDDDTRGVVEKNRADEQGHIDLWRSMMKG